MSEQPIIVTASWPTYSRIGRWIAILAIPWFFGLLLAAEALKLIGPEGPRDLRIPVLVVALAPAVFAFLGRWLGHLPGFRWMHHPQQPQLTIRQDRLDVQLPGLGSVTHDWDEIQGMRARRSGGADLLGPGGAILERLPESLTMAGGTWWRSESIAELVARSQPERFRVSGANWAGAPNAFARRTAEDSAASDPTWAGRRMVVNVGLVLLALAMVAYFTIGFAQR